MASCGSIRRTLASIGGFQRAVAYARDGGTVIALLPV